MMIGSIVLWAAFLFSGKHIAWGQISGKAWWSMGYAVVFSGMLGHVFWYEGIGRIGVTRTMTYQYLTPIWAVVFNYFLMREEIFPQQILGGVLILLGVHRVLRS